MNSPNSPYVVPELLQPGARIDPANCAREPIHTPGSIQPHGALLVVRVADGVVVQTTEASRLVFGLDPDDVLGRSLADVCGAEAAEIVRAAGGAHRAYGVQPLRIEIAGVTLDAHCHVPAEGLVAIDLEPAAALPAAVQQTAGRISGWAADLQGAEDVDTVLEIATDALHELVGFDRTWAYRFADDDHGIIAVERCRIDLISFDGLHFPESDIPSQARELYLKHGTRVIGDVRARPNGLVPPDGQGGAPWLDLSGSGLRAVSPMHVRYLGNMGVLSSLSVPIGVDGRLFALLSAHNYTRVKRVSMALRAECDALGAMVSMRMASVLQLERARGVARARDAVATLVEGLAATDDLSAVFAARQGALLDLCGASGAVVSLGSGRLHHLGVTPPADAVHRFAAVVDQLLGAREILATDCSADLPGVGEHPEEAAGVLVARLAAGHGRWIAWFRPERVEEVTWGNRDKQLVVREPSGDLRLGYRESFERWVEEVRGTARPWQAAEIEGAERLRGALGSFLIEHAERLARVNRELARSNEELDAFAYAAAHDLQVPVHTIERLVRSVVDRQGDRLDEQLSGDLELAADMAESVDGLLRSLLEYAKVGARQQHPQEVSLRAVTREVLRMLGERLPAEAIVDVHDVRVQADVVSIRQVLLNLIWNAIKYSDGPPRITVGIEQRDEPLPVLFVRDRGIGIAPEHHEHVFELFRRLHTGTEASGDGAGLAVCRRLVERYGGRIWIESELGAGTTVCWTQPSVD